MTIAEQVGNLIDKRIRRINTLDFALVVATHPEALRVDVVLKHKTSEQVDVVLKNVPVMASWFGQSGLFIAPDVGDTVLVGYSKYERERQVTGTNQVQVDPLTLHNLNNAVVLAGAPIPGVGLLPTDLAPGEIALLHRSGSYLKFEENGDLEIKASHIKMVQKTS